MCAQSMTLGVIPQINIVSAILPHRPFLGFNSGRRKEIRSPPDFLGHLGGRSRIRLQTPPPLHLRRQAYASLSLLNIRNIKIGIFPPVNSAAWLYRQRSALQFFHPDDYLDISPHLPAPGIVYFDDFGRFAPSELINEPPNLFAFFMDPYGSLWGRENQDRVAIISMGLLSSPIRRGGDIDLTIGKGSQKADDSRSGNRRREY